MCTPHEHRCTPHLALMMWIEPAYITGGSQLMSSILSLCTKGCCIPQFHLPSTPPACLMRPTPYPSGPMSCLCIQVYSAPPHHPHVLYCLSNQPPHCPPSHPSPLLPVNSMHAFASSSMVLLLFRLILYVLWPHNAPPNPPPPLPPNVPNPFPL